MTGVGRETRFSNTTSYCISAVKLFTTFQDLVPKWCRYTNPLTHVLLHPCILHHSLAKSRALETSLSSPLCVSVSNIHVHGRFLYLVTVQLLNFGMRISITTWTHSYNFRSAFLLFTIFFLLFNSY